MSYNKTSVLNQTFQNANCIEEEEEEDTKANYIKVK